MKTAIEILEEIKKELNTKFDNDPLIKNTCQIIINEFKLRTEFSETL